MAITPENIFAAADALVEQGQEPTLTAVRSAVGGGSFSTISEAMKAWRARREAQRQERAAPIPADLQEAGAGLLTQVWRQAVGLAEGRLERERAALGEARADLEAQTRQAVSLADQMEREITLITAERDAAREKAEELQSERERRQEAEAGAAERFAAVLARLEAAAGRS